MRKVRLFNLTDVETPGLKDRGQINITVSGRGFAVPPGESREVVITEGNRQSIQHAVSAGLLSVDNLPASYMLLKGRKPNNRRERR
jgi:hypothetical protein